jgi:16S rRNA (cytosine1402-N4)-methyltransferase
VNVLNVVKMPSAPPSPPPAFPHVSVMLPELLDALAPRRGQVFVDATLGAGGHAEAVLEIEGTRVIGIDRDDTALAIAKKRLERFGDRFTPVKARFGELTEVLERMGVATVNGLYADVGLSSMQIDDSERGMSFRQEGPLDMRMDPSSGETALELIERLDADELADVIFKLGEERRSRRVARCIKQAADAGELKTTLDLRRAVVRAVGPARVGGVDPATRTFQALRIAVNQEIEELVALTEAAAKVVVLGGVFAVISFHSLEDRVVKRAMRDRGVWAPLTKKPLTPSDAEISDNPRARSAKLRAARRSDGAEGTFDGFDAEETIA